jgi:hypothetical protein
MIERFRLWWKQLRCEHFWRPAVKSGGIQVKVCDYCEKCVELSVEEFYALFGRMPFI